MTSMAFNLELIFPIRDVKCLWDAGVIDDRQRKLVHQRAAVSAAKPEG
jgi:hypothetical protein